MTSPSETERTEPYEVCVKGVGDTIGYACPKCKLFCSPTIYACKWEDALKAAYKHAVDCCGDIMCQDCGTNMGPRKGTAWLLCKDCRAKKDNERESKLFREAKKIPYSEYEGTFLYFADEFYDEPEYLLEKFEDDPPKYAWACDPQDLAMDVEDWLESALEEHHEEARCDISNHDVKRLQKYVDLWCKKVAVRSFFPNFKLAVMLEDVDADD